MNKGAGVYDIFTKVINRKTHKKLIETIKGLILPEDDVLECAYGTGLLTGVIAENCNSLVVTDFSRRMIKKPEKKYGKLENVEFEQGNILKIDYPRETFDVVVAANVIHLLDEPYKAISELDRVCKAGGRIIIPTYMNGSENEKKNGLSGTADRAGADFKREFTLGTYKQFIKEAGFDDVSYEWCDGKIPCAVAIIKKGKK
ncbi:MAG: class I SAM-dependent methyltransferase [Clostridia bacterium]|nr:class I SAM-dependent methyltransferase [Clostridia bacterium]